MRDHNTVEVDVEKLRRQLLKRGYTFKKAAVEIGKSHTYFSKLSEGGAAPGINGPAD